MKCLPSSDDYENKEEEERSIITYEEGKKAFGIFKQYIKQLDHATANVTTRSSLPRLYPHPAYIPTFELNERGDINGV